MDEHVRLADRGEYVNGLVFLGRREALRRSGRPGREVQLRPFQSCDLGQRGEVEHAAHFVAVLVLEADPLQQTRADALRRRAFDLEANGGPETSAPQLLLDREQEVVGFVLLDREVGVPGDPEEVRLVHRHAREQDVEIRGDELLDRHEGRRVDLHEPRHHRRHLHAREELLAGLRLLQADGQREAERGDVRERPSGIDRERRQDREQLPHEPVAQPIVVLGDLRVAGNANPRLGKLHAQAVEHGVLEAKQLLYADADRGELLCGAHAVGRQARPANLSLLMKPGDADGEELVEVVGEDRQEAHALEQRVPFVARFVEHTLVEVQPRELPVQVNPRGPIGGQTRSNRARQRLRPREHRGLVKGGQETKAGCLRRGSDPAGPARGAPGRRAAGSRRALLPWYPRSRQFTTSWCQAPPIRAGTADLEGRKITRVSSAAPRTNVQGCEPPMNSRYPLR